MQLGMIGLGRMGGNMVRRLLRAGHECVVYDRVATHTEKLVSEGAVGTKSIEDFCARLAEPRTAWVMVPAGVPTEETVTLLARHMRAGDIIIDGGNSHYKDDVRRARQLATSGLHYLDVGTSGGVWGAERGYCLMIGGNRQAFDHLLPIWKALAPGRGDIPPTPGREKARSTSEEGYLYCGPAGAGHFVKMIHNGIEYGLMQAYAEGFDILQKAGSETLPEEGRYQFPLAEVAEVWRRGSVIGSWLLDLTASALAEDPALARYTGYVEDSGEGRWTVMAALEEAVPIPVLSASLYARFRSRQEHTFAEKILSAMRKKFGGHVEPGDPK